MIDSPRIVLGSLCALALLAAGSEARTSPITRFETADSQSKEKDRVRKLYGIAWHSTVDGALAEAQKTSTRRREKPVVWLRMLGDLAGKT